MSIIQTNNKQELLNDMSILNNKNLNEAHSLLMKMIKTDEEKRISFKKLIKSYKNIDDKGKNEKGCSFNNGNQRKEGRLIEISKVNDIKKRKIEENYNKIPGGSSSIINISRLYSKTSKIDLKNQYLKQRKIRNRYDNYDKYGNDNELSLPILKNTCWQQLKIDESKDNEEDERKFHKSINERKEILNEIKAKLSQLERKIRLSNRSNLIFNKIEKIELIHLEGRLNYFKQDEKNKKESLKEGKKEEDCGVFSKNQEKNMDSKEKIGKSKVLKGILFQLNGIYKKKEKCQKNETLSKDEIESKKKYVSNMTFDIRGILDIVYDKVIDIKSINTKNK